MPHHPGSAEPARSRPSTLDGTMTALEGLWMLPLVIGSCWWLSWAWLMCPHHPDHPHHRFASNFVPPRLDHLLFA